MTRPNINAMRGSERRGTRRAIAGVIGAWVIAAMCAAPASALEVPEVGVPSTPALGTESPSPLPTPSEEPEVEGVVGTVNDTVTGLGGEAPTLPGSPGGGGSGGGEPGTSGGNGGGSGNGGSGGSGSNGSATTGSSRTGGGGTGDARGSDASPGGEIPVSGGAEARAAETGDEPYHTLATRGTVEAIGRALKMMGPLAPAIGLGIVAVFVLIGLSRGSTRLVKLDESKFRDHIYRL